MKKRLLPFLLVLCLAMGLLSGGVFAAANDASGTLGDNLTWTLSVDGTLTISGTGDMQDYSSFSHSPFYENKSIRSVVIEPGVTSIGEFCFKRCPNLQNVSIPDTVTRIGVAAFSTCGNLSEITIPASVKEIEEAVFHACENLQSVQLPSGLQKIGDMAFMSCTSLAEIVIPDSVREIGVSAFSHCSSLEYFVIPEGVKTIMGTTFRGCEKMELIQIPESVTEIEEEAFDCCMILDTILYTGTADQWNAITIHNEMGKIDETATFFANNPLMNAELYFRTRLPVQFTDVRENAFYADAVDWAYMFCITNGTGNGKFSPNATCTRAQVVTFLWRAVGEPEPETTENPFTDVPNNKYYTKAVLWASENHITEGLTENTFGPNQGCTRGQVVTFLHRLHGKPAPAQEDNPFTDVVQGKFFFNAVLWAFHDGITKGTTATLFSPNKTCTRGEIVTFLYRDLAELE